MSKIAAEFGFGGRYKTYPFFFRTREQYLQASSIHDSIEWEMSSVIHQKKFMRQNIFRLELESFICSPPWEHSQKLRDKKIPIDEPGKKKYPGTIIVGEDVPDLLSFDINKELSNIGLEIAPRTPNPPKYRDDEVTCSQVRLKNEEHFQQLIASLNSRYGHGNWKIRGCKKLRRKLRERNNDSMATFASMIDHPLTDDQIRNGIKVEVVVFNRVDDLEKSIFKVALMSL